MMPAKSLLALSVLATLSLLTLPAAANDDDHRSITVIGNGEVRSTPDIATMSIGVGTEAATPATALAANAKRMTEVMARLKKAGIEDKDLQTSRLTIWPVYAGQDRPREIIAYSVSNQLAVTIRDLSRLGAILDQAVLEGANQVNGPSFMLANPTPHLNNARDAAITDAIAKAERYAAAANVTLGQVLSIDETVSSPSFPKLNRAQAMDASTPIAPGETALSASVTMRFSID